MRAPRLARVLTVAGPLILAAACAQVPDNLVVLVEDPDGGVGEVAVANAGGAETLNTPGAALGIAAADAAPEPLELDAATVDEIFGPAIAARAPAPYAVSLYFESGTASLTAESAADLDAAIAHVVQRPVPDISVIGHTDTQGDAEANVRLGLDRAGTVRDTLVSAGVDPSIVSVVSHGESNPLVPTADDVDEPRNRRVELIVR